MSDEAPIKRWTAKPKSAVPADILKAKVRPVKTARQHDLAVSEWDVESIQLRPCREAVTRALKT